MFPLNTFAWKRIFEHVMYQIVMELIDMCERFIQQQNKVPLQFDAEHVQRYISM